MTKANFVKKARKDYPEHGIKRGDSYWWWQFRFSKHVYKSLKQPRKSQLTQSEHLSAIYEIEERIEDMQPVDIDTGCIDEIIGDIETVRDTCQERLDNMPEQLQDSNSGSILQEYIEALENWQQELEGVDLYIDEDSLQSEAENEWEDEHREDEIQLAEDDKQRLNEIAEIKDRLVEEKRQEILDEIQSISSGV